MVWAHFQETGYTGAYYNEGMFEGKWSIEWPKSTWLTNIADWTGKSVVICLREATA